MKKTIEIDVTDIWIAALFDGEGCVHIRKQEGTISVSIGQDYHPILDELFMAFPEAAEYYEKAHLRKDGTQRPERLHFKLTKIDAVERFLLMVLPWVVEKKDQVELGLEYIKFRLTHTVNNTPDAVEWAARMSALKNVSFVRGKQVTSEQEETNDNTGRGHRGRRVAPRRKPGVANKRARSVNWGS